MKYEAKTLRSAIAVSLSLMTSGSAHAQMMQGRPAISPRTTAVAPVTTAKTIGTTTFVSPTSLFTSQCRTPTHYFTTRTPYFQQACGPRVINCSRAAYSSYPVIYPGYYYTAGYASYGVPVSYGYGDNSPPDTTDAPASLSDYSTWGHDWAQDLRRNVVAWDQFVVFCREQIVNAAPEAIADFRGAFIEAYGTNGQAALDKALGEAWAMQQQAQQAPGPKVITVQKSGY